jgi:hypothetical protein
MAPRHGALKSVTALPLVWPVFRFAEPVKVVLPISTNGSV